jgi:hypothetical protein
VKGRAVSKEITHTTEPAKLGQRAILVIANESLDGATLRDVIGPRADGDSPAELLVIVPALNSRLRHWLSDEDEARRRAAVRLAAVLEDLRATGMDAEGRVGDADPLQALTDAVNQFGAQEIAIASGREGRSHWLRRDLVARARRRFVQPVVHVAQEPASRDRGARGANVAAGRPHGANA